MPFKATNTTTLNLQILLGLLSGLLKVVATLLLRPSIAPIGAVFLSTTNKNNN